MASIMIQDINDGLKRDLSARAAENGRSIEEEAREILRKAIVKPPAPMRGKIGEAIHRRFAALGGVELDLPSREPMLEPPRFDLVGGDDPD